MPTRKLSDEIQEDRRRLLGVFLSLLGNCCEHSGCPHIFIANPNLHECLVPFNSISNVQSDDLDRLLGLHVANILLLCNSPCHLNRKPGPADSIQALKKRPRGFYEFFGFADFHDALRDFRCRLDSFYESGILKIRIGNFHDQLQT